MSATLCDPTQSAYRGDMRRALTALREGGTPHVPPAVGLRRRRPRAHFHPFPEFFLQVGGRSRFECPGETFVLEQGRTCVIPAGVPHAETPENGRTPYGIVVCMRGREGVMLQRARRGRDGAIVGYGSLSVPSPRGRDAFELLDRLNQATAHPAPDAGPDRRALAEVFLLTVLAELDRPAVAAPVGSPLVAEAEKLALAALPDPALTVARLARSLGCTADHLSRIYRAERGVTLKTWIVAERIALARELLRDSRHQVAEVARACGFGQPSYFIRVFNARAGMTPGEFRRRAGTA